MGEVLYRKLTENLLDEAQVRMIIEWQLSKPEKDIDCQLIEECLQYLFPDTQGLSPEKKEAMLSGFKADIKKEKAVRPSVKTCRHRRPKRMAIVIALLLLMALSATAVAYWIGRGVLNFNEDFGWGIPIRSQKGAKAFVHTGVLAHKELEHVTIDVLEAAYDGAEMRIVYAITSKVGEPYLQQGDRDTYIIPGAKEDEVHMCDYVLINDQESFFYDTYETLGEQTNQVLYYLQTNLKAHDIYVAGEENLTIELPILGRPVYGQKRETVEFAISAEVPENMVRRAELIKGTAEHHEVTLSYAGFSPVCGYVELHFSDISREEFERIFYGMGNVVSLAGEPLTGAHLEGNVREENGGITLGFSVMPPSNGWPDQMEFIV